MQITRCRPRCVYLVALFLLGTVVAGHAQQPVSSPVIAPSLIQQVQLPPAPEMPTPRKVVDRKFLLMSAALMGLTIADLERTQHCLGQHTCVELNPMLPHSRAGMYAVNIPMNAAAMYLGYRLKSAGRKSWLIAPALMSAGHLFGAAWRM